MAESVRWLTSAEVRALGLDPAGREAPDAPRRLTNKLGPAPALERVWLEDDVLAALAAERARFDPVEEMRKQICARLAANERARAARR